MVSMIIEMSIIKEVSIIIEVSIVTPSFKETVSSSYASKRRPVLGILFEIAEGELSLLSINSVNKI